MYKLTVKQALAEGIDAKKNGATHIDSLEIVTAELIIEMLSEGVPLKDHIKSEGILDQLGIPMIVFMKWVIGQTPAIRSDFDLSMSIQNSAKQERELDKALQDIQDAADLGDSIDESMFEKENLNKRKAIERKIRSKQDAQNSRLELMKHLHTVDNDQKKLGQVAQQSQATAIEAPAATVHITDAQMSKLKNLKKK